MYVYICIYDICLCARVVLACDFHLCSRAVTTGEVDKINQNQLADDHVSFTVLELKYFVSLTKASGPQNHL